MLKKVTLASILLALIFSCESFADLQYNPTDVDTFLKTGQCPHCDLTRASLWSKTIANVNVHEAILTEANLSSSIYAAGDFSGANMLSAYMANSNFSGSNFQNTVLSTANMSYGNFSRSNFTGANVSGANLDHAILIQAIINSEQLASVKTLSCAVLPDGTRHASDNGQSC